MDKENDPFSKIVKDKLTKYTLPVDEGMWDKIEKQLNTVPPKKTERRWIAAAIAVAASIALLFVLLPINNKKTYNYETANQLSDHEETIIQDVFEEPINQLVFSQDFETSSVFKKSQPSKQLAENYLTVEVIPEKEIVKEENSPTSVETEELIVPENRRIFPIGSYDFLEEQIPIIKQKKRQSIRLSLGSGGNLMAQNSMDNSQGSNRSYGKSSNSELYFFRSAVQEVSESRTKTILENENYPNVVHRLPLSLGITVKKELNQSFAIESGVVYSFVSTLFSRESPKSQASLQLHYVGIPLNLHTSIYKDRFSQWEVYLSAGGMIEKGILSHFSQKNYYDDINNHEMTVISNEKIDGFQWSVGISPGVDFKIHKNYSIYLEPKLNYYFDNDQPESARTQYPIVVGINAGVRYVW